MSIFKFKLKKVLILTAGWTVAGIYFTIPQHFILFIFFKNTPYLYPFWTTLIITIIFTILIGLLIGSIEIFYFRNKLRNKTFIIVIIIKAIFYLCSLALIVISFYFIQNKGFIYLFSIFPEYSQQLKNVIPFAIFYNILNWVLILGITKLIINVNRRLGQGSLQNIFRGKYYSPKEELRIFMFLDIRSSTTIAEKLGHVKYFSFLNEFFYDVTDPIILHRGEIYQYVGDELVVTWKIEKGIEDTNCIDCFFSIQETIENKSNIYMNKYGIIPSFKAGLHCGSITVGEVGEIKRDIVFTGDVLNTASRIEELCNKFNKNILISKTLLDILYLDNKYQSKEISKIKLRGKQGEDTIYSIKRI